MRLSAAAIRAVPRTFRFRDRWSGSLLVAVSGSRLLSAWWLIAAVCWCAPQAGAQIPAIDEFLGRTSPAEPLSDPAAPAEKATAESSAAALQAKRAAIAERISVAQRELESADGAGGAPDAATGEVERLKRLKVVYGQQQAAATKTAELEAMKQQAVERLAELREQGLEDEPPYSFFLLDRLRDELQTLTQRAASAAAATTGATDALQAAKTAADEAHRKLRQASETARERKSSEDAAPQPPHKSLELDAQIADEQVKLCKTELANERLNQEVIELDLALAAEKIEHVAPQVALTEEQQQDKLVELDKEEADLEFAHSEAEQRLEYLTKRVEEAETAPELAAEPDAAQTADLEARRVARSAQQQYVNLLNEQLERLADRREAWMHRFEVHRQTAGREQLSDWSDEAAQSIEELAREDRLQDRELDDVRKQLADVEKRLQSATAEETELRRSLNEQRRTYQELINQYGENIISIELTSRVQQRLHDDIQQDRLSFGERLREIWAYVTYVWGYEVVVSEDQPVTVSMIVWGIVLLVLGLLISRWASAALGKRFLPRLGVHESAASALQSITFYTLVTLTALLALRWVNVPLTLFTFLGGAVAIGVGFGSQNLVNNFISGLILLAERPIRKGDVIEIDNLVGSVDSIGARSTRIRTVTNYEIIVPNSSFLERNVVNWTLSDKRVRCSIAVGVAYGSPTREVARWLKKAAEEHGQVLERPEPFVWFVNFGDNALDFELHYWITIRAMSERRRIESDLRFIIDQYFREAGLVIAFPQRDLHLDTQRPLQVSLLSGDEIGVSQESAKAA